MKPTLLSVSLGLVLLLVPVALGALPEIHVDRATVKVEKRGSKDWCVIDAQVSSEVALPISSLMAIIEDYPTYPQLFPEIRETKVASVPGAALVTEKVVIAALGIENTNRFTLRLVRTDTDDGRTTRLDWTQEWVDGTIDSLEGHWILVDKGTPGTPKVSVVYWARSAVPVMVAGQDVVIGLLLGGKTKGILEAVFKKALSR